MRERLFPLTAALIMLAVCHSFCTSPCRGSSSRVNSPATPEYDNEVDDGILILNGQLIPGPYFIEATGKHCTVNGVSADHIVVHANEQDVADERGRRRGRPRGRRRVDEVSKGVQIASRLAGLLLEDWVVVAYDGYAAMPLSIRSEEVTFLETLAAEVTTPEQKEAFAALCRHDALASKWTQMLVDIRPTAVQRNNWQFRIDYILDGVSGNEFQAAALRRFEQLRYPFTVIAMLLGAISLEHLFRWARKGVTDKSQDTAKACKFGLMLIVALSIVDLSWTIIAAQAGQMTEINPLAASLIHSPFALMLLKGTSLAISISILYGLRTQQIVQRATWWMCFVLVLVTFRWAVFDTLI